MPLPGDGGAPPALLVVRQPSVGATTVVDRRQATVGCPSPRSSTRRAPGHGAALADTDRLDDWRHEQHECGESPSDAYVAALPAVIPP